VVHPIVRTHPETGRKAIFLGDHAEKIEAMDHAQGRALIDEVNQRATAAPLGYEHVWSPRQCLVWDNRCLMHRATTYDTAKERRVMRRCTILGDQPF
jgi:taurine dioxygenase